MNTLQKLKTDLKGHIVQLIGITIFAICFLVVSNFKLWNEKPEDLYFTMTQFIVITVIGLMYISYYCLFIKKLAFEKCYLLIGITFGIFFMFIFPPYSTPDEVTHMWSAYYVSNEIMGYDDPTEEGVKLMVRACEANASTTGELNQYVSRDGYNNTLSNLFKVADASDNELVPSTISYVQPYSAYVIPAIGITIGRLLSWGVVPSAMLGTMFNMLFFVFSSYYAMKKIPFGKMILASYCLLPMTLHLVSSFSYDNSLLAATAVVIALGLRWAFTENKITKSEMIVYLIYSAMLVLGKGGVYSVFCILPFLYGFSKEHIKDIWKNYKKQIIIGVIILISAWFLVRFGDVLSVLQGRGKEVVTETETVVYENYIAWADAEGYTLKGLLSEPQELFDIVLNTIVEKSDYYLMTLYGQALGWFQVGIPYMVVFIYGVIGILSALSIDGKCFLSGKDKLIVVFLAILCSGMCVLALLLDHTPKGWEYIEGVQGRYLLPPYLACLFCLGGENMRLKKNMERELLFALVPIGAIMMLYIMRHF